MPYTLLAPQPKTKALVLSFTNAMILANQLNPRADHPLGLLKAAPALL
jgi:hypothetical protein